MTLYGKFLDYLRKLYSIVHFQLCRSKDGIEIKSIPSLNNRHEIIKPEGKFIIALGLEQDAGNYTCSYKNESRAFEVLANVFVKLPSNINVVENEKLTVLCGVSGTQVTIKWLVDGEFVVKNPIVLIIKILYYIFI